MVIVVDIVIDMKMVQPIEIIIKIDSFVETIGEIIHCNPLIKFSSFSSLSGHLSQDHDHNGHQTFRSSSPPFPNSANYHYRSSRTPFNSRPVSSRNAPSRHYRQHENDDYPSSVNRNSNQSSYYDNRSSNHRELYPPTFLDQPTIPSNVSYYTSSSSSSSPPPVGFPRDRNLPLSSQGYMESDRNRYMPVSNR